MNELMLGIEFGEDEVAEAEAPAPRMIIVDKRLEDELATYKRAANILLGVEE